MFIPQARIAPAANQAEPAILLVNDDPGALFALRSVLGDLDAALVTASSGEQALLRLLKQDFCVILMDVKMAGLDGFETARLVRARPRSRATPIVFLTSHRASDLDRSRGFEVGASDYIFMPVAPEMLKAKVQAFIDGARERRPVRAVGSGPGGEAPDAGIERLILEHAGDYVALLDPTGAWLYTSPSYRAEFGAAVGPGARYLEIVHVDDRDRVRALVEHPPPGESHWRLQYRVLGRSERHFESDASLIRASNGAVSQLVLISRDITERKEMEAYVLHQSFHDSLTGLPNRLLLLDRLGQATAQRERQRAQVAVLFLDLDHFKEVNDTLGHAAGDRLLQVVAERLAASVREGDTVARVGGDEFAVMLVELHQLADAALVAEKIISTVSETCQIEGSELHITPSIGMAIFPGDGVDPDTLLRNADIAMYHAKRDGGAHYCFFTAQMQEVASQRLALGSALQRAIRNGEFVMHYQPKVRAASGAIIGFEALIRWPQADGASISPSLFIPIAEETGRIDPIGAWAIGQVAAELQRWTGLGFDDVPIAVNVSALQFRREDVARSLGAAVDAAQIQPAMLEVELTESGVMSNPAQAIETLHQIHALGMTIAIDDFGTGYSSLAYLKRFPIDKLKIDASFVRDIATDPSDAAIVLAIIGLAHVLGLTVIAKGSKPGNRWTSWSPTVATNYRGTTSAPRFPTRMRSAFSGAGRSASRQLGSIMTTEQAAPERRVEARRKPGRRALDAAAHERRGRRAGAGIGVGAPAGADGAPSQALLLDALMALRAGDFSVRLPHDWTGIDGKIADAVNDIVATHGKLAGAVERVSVAVGLEGRLGQRMMLDKTDGAWGDEVDAINSMIDNLVQPVREVGPVIGAVARGVLTESMLLGIDGRPLRGEFLMNANTINTMLADR